MLCTFINSDSTFSTLIPQIFWFPVPYITTWTLSPLTIYYVRLDLRYDLGPDECIISM